MLDGHGPNGHHVSRFVQRSLQHLLPACLPHFTETVSTHALPLLLPPLPVAAVAVAATAPLAVGSGGNSTAGGGIESGNGSAAALLSPSSAVGAGSPLASPSAHASLASPSSLSSPPARGDGSGSGGIFATGISAALEATSNAGTAEEDEAASRLLTSVLRHTTHCLDRSGIDLSISGSTCVLCVIAPVREEASSASASSSASSSLSSASSSSVNSSSSAIAQRCIWSANIGDSRAIVARRIAAVDAASSSGRSHFESHSQSVHASSSASASSPPRLFAALPLTADHKPEGAERRRIQRAGGRVAPFISPVGDAGSMRVWLRDQALPGLAMTRALGDSIGRRAGIIAEPSVTCHRVDDARDEFLIIASDGVWDCLSNDEVVQMLSERAVRVGTGGSGGGSGSGSSSGSGDEWSFDSIDLQAACDAIVTEATRRFMEREDISDDTSIVIVRL